MICAGHPCHPEKGDIVRILLVSTQIIISKVKHKRVCTFLMMFSKSSWEKKDADFRSESLCVVQMHFHYIEHELLVGIFYFA